MTTTDQDQRNVADFLALLGDYPREILKRVPNDVLAQLAAEAIAELLTRAPKPVPVEEHLLYGLEYCARWFVEDSADLLEPVGAS